MPRPLPEGQHITVERNLRPANFSMPSLEMATDHYNIGFVVSGDRRAITPLQSYCYHAGDVAMSPPFVYHRTLSESDAPYDGYLIKYSPEFIQPFIDQIGKNIFDELYEQKVCHFTPNMQVKIEQLFADMLEEYHKQTPYKEVILQGMLFRLLTTVYENKLESTATRFKSPLTPPIIDTLYYIENHYSQKITLSAMAKEVHLSEAYLSRLFTSQLGMSFTDYVNNVRIRHVQTMLTRTDKSVMEIALACGYCHGDYLSAQFKLKTGMTPLGFRRKRIPRSPHIHNQEQYK